MRGIIDRIFDKLSQWQEYVTKEVWAVGQPGEELPDSFLAQQARVLVLLFQKFVRDQLFVRAGALAFATALAIVPLLALLFIIIQGLNLGENLYVYLEREFDQRLEQVSRTWSQVVPGGEEAPEQAGQPAGDMTEPGLPAPDSAESAPEGEMAEAGDDEAPPSERAPPREEPVADAEGTGSEEATKRAFEQLIGLMFQGLQADELGEEGQVNIVRAIADTVQKSASNPGAIGLTGLIFLVATVFGLMRNVEQSFVVIWGTKPDRTFFRMFSEYLAIALLLPIVALGVLGMTAALSSEQVLDALGPLQIVFQSVRFVAIWLAFALLYQIVPTAKVRFRYALVGGIVAGTLWVLLSSVYVEFQIGISNYSIFWGVLAQVPMILMWTFLSWMIVLFGAELTYAYQHEKTFAMERWASDASYGYREAVGLRAMLEIAWRFQRGLPPMEPQRCAEEWNVPTRVVNEMLDALTEAGLSTRCGTEVYTYLPAVSLDRVTVSDVVSTFRSAGSEPSALREDPAFKEILDAVQESGNGFGRKSINDVVREHAAALTSPEQRLHRIEEPKNSAGGGTDEDEG